jgi:hypothetical protein
MIKGTCSRCGSPYEIDSSYAGKTAICNECKAKFKLPPLIQNNQPFIRKETIRKIVLWVGFGLVMLMGIFPPWKKNIAHENRYRVRGGVGVGVTVYYQNLDGGYHFLFNHPIDKDTNVSFSLDSPRLAIQWVLVGLPTIVFGYVTRRGGANKVIDE